MQWYRMLTSNIESNVNKMHLEDCCITGDTLKNSLDNILLNSWFR